MAAAGDQLQGPRDTITVDGNYYVSYLSMVALTVEGDFGGGTLKLYQGDENFSASTTVVGGTETAGYTADLSIQVNVGSFRVELVGATNPNLQIFLVPIFGN